MAQKRTWESLFQNRDEDFSRKPNPQLWDRLEKRLDSHKEPAKKLRFIKWHPLLSLAASVVILIGLAAILLQTFKAYQSKKQFASADALPESIESLEIDGAFSAFQAELQVIRQYKSRFSNLVASQPIADGYRAPGEVGVDVQPSAAETWESNRPLAKLENFNPNKAGTLTLEKQFSWLPGAWHSGHQGLEQVESWQVKKPGLIQGVRHFIQGDDTLFTEHMRLLEDQKQLYFAQSGYLGQGEQLFQLVDNQSDTQWVFQALDKGFIREVRFTTSAPDLMEVQFLTNPGIKANTDGNLAGQTAFYQKWFQSIPGGYKREMARI